MTTPAWPTTLPCSPMFPFSEQRQRNIRAFNPEVGPPKMALRSTAASVKFACVFKFTKAQLAIFKTFYETTLADGTLPFTWKNPIDGVTYNWMFAPDEAPTDTMRTVNHHAVEFTLFRLPP